MDIQFVRLLQIQRDLYDLPRGRERFEAYLRTMIDPATGDLALPLASMNPMAREHAGALVDDYLRLDAEAAAASAVSSAGAAYGDVPAAFRVGLVIADDLKGGWTNRFASEFSARYETGALHKRSWLAGMLWTSEPAGLDRAVQAAVMAVHRAAYLERHGQARTLRDMLAQEGFAAAAAGCTEPALDPDDLAYTRAVVDPLRGLMDRPTIFAVLFGDAAAAELGYAPLGLSHRAGFALALHEARHPTALAP